MEDRIHLRTMTLEDIDQVLHVERSSFSNPWTREAFENELRHNRFATYFVAEDGDRIVGYCGVWVILDESHITNIAVLPEYRGLKIGETLLRKAMLFAKLKRAKQMSLEVRVSNHIAQNLYRKLGFKDGGIRKGYYSDNHEDALVMWVEI
ncbi:ribosomal protein S18-alanine N-acetyltransferase [Caenibacillus caldisaponilyticus]|uniref:ribosomal protein S18-alanine N-acetyltransferase n=1 Tax=Caenibacillus caldisaponilyticus TaxID=1674942 RepID=UPI001874E644|nr:ribosomal protein S18-alanine N-acetyltransferase [Caenibacillus caldisaponilyticus]